MRDLNFSQGPRPCLTNTGFRGIRIPNNASTMRPSMRAIPRVDRRNSPVMGMPMTKINENREKTPPNMAHNPNKHPVKAKKSMYKKELHARGSVMTPKNLLRKDRVSGCPVAARRSWTRDSAQSGAGFFTLGVHALDLARWLAEARASR